MKINVIVNTQIHENYGESADGKHEIWKRKGCQKFTFKIDRMEWDYADYDKKVDMIQSALLNHSDDFFRYEYIDHEVYWNDIIKLEVDEEALI